VVVALLQNEPNDGALVGRQRRERVDDVLSALEFVRRIHAARGVQLLRVHRLSEAVALAA